MKYAYLFGGAIGDSLVGMHLARSLEHLRPGARLTLLSTRRKPFVSDLVRGLPFVSYREFLWDSPRTWWVGLWLFLTPTSIFVFDPTDVPLPRWWRFILAISTVLPGSREVHSQLVGHERRVARGVTVLVVTPEDNLFTTNVPRILSAWGIRGESQLAPSLPKTHFKTPPGRYVLFHFFAGNYRRSWPLEKAHPFLIEARQAFPEYEFVLTASNEERGRAQEMVKGVNNARVESGLSAQALLRYLSDASLVVGVASGVTHISSHLAVPTIALANLSDPYWLPSYAEHTRILANREECRCKGNKEGECVAHAQDGLVFRCLYYISATRILEEMVHFLEP